MRKAHLIAGLALLTLLLSAGAALMIYPPERPQVLDARYCQDGGPCDEAFQGSLDIPSRGVAASVWLTLRLPPRADGALLLHVDDCLEEIQVNGRTMAAALPHCDYFPGVRLNLARFARDAESELLLSFLLRDKGGQLKFAYEFVPPARAALGWIALGVTWSLFLFALTLLLARRKNRAFAAALFAILLLGAVLRIGYTAVTPIGTRGHDIYAHTDYVKAVMQDWRIPPAAKGWEFHQPPVYYFLAAGVGKALEAAGAGDSGLFRGLQWLSTLLSVFTLGAAVLAGYLLFPERQKHRALLLFALLAAVFPGLLYFASRVSNDALFQLILFLLFALFIRWWQTGSNRLWYASAVLLGFGLLVKVSFVVLVPVFLLSLLLRPKVKMTKKALLTGAFLIIIATIAGWLTALRILEANNVRYLALGNEALDPVVILPNILRNFLTFNPVRMLQIPYNSAWIDAGGRQYYWEYFFKSVFLGEWDFGPRFLPVVRAMLFFGFGFIPLLILGIIADIRARRLLSIPVFFTMGTLQGASLTYRVLHTCSCNQDFRFVPLLLLPVLYYVLRGAESLPHYLRLAAHAWLIAFAVTSVIFAGQLVWT